MSGKLRVIIALYHRDELSIRENRQQLGQAAYHWGIVVQPKKPKDSDSNAYDVTDGAMPDPLTRVDHNPNRDWYFRTKLGVNPMRSGRLLGRIMIGKVPPHITNARIEEILREIPLPAKDATPAQNCVTWVLAAIEVMQMHGLAEVFDVPQFSIKALELADQWLQNPNPHHVHNYTNRPY